MNDAPFTARRSDTIDKAIEVFSDDPRVLAGWLEGSLADRGADSFSDIDLYLCVAEDAFNDVWNDRREFIGRVRPILACADVMGIFGIGCLLEGPVKLDVFFERESTLTGKQRIAVKWLWGPNELFARLRIGDDLGDAAIARTLEYTVMGFLQGATWPVRLLARGQRETFFFGAVTMIETGIVPLMLLEHDRRAFHRNMFTRAKMLMPAQHAEYARLMEHVRATMNAPIEDREAMRALHIDIFKTTCRLARPAFARYGLAFPPRAEEEMLAFYQREWPA